MSSDTLSILSSLQLNDYTSGMTIVNCSWAISRATTVAAMTVVVYDYGQ
jgi:hypothetical protein